MKGIVILSLLFSITATAQIGGMDQADIQRMMQGAQQVQKCFASVDQAAIESLMQQGKAMEEKIAQLCKTGKQSEAESQAMKFAFEMKNDKNVKAMRKCGEGMAGMMSEMMPELPFAEFDDHMKEDAGHLCDGY